ncbi:hypothetical protein ACTXT7_000447 [Hymenolepis weldensis]
MVYYSHGDSQCNLPPEPGYADGIKPYKAFSRPIQVEELTSIALIRCDFDSM